MNFGAERALGVDADSRECHRWRAGTEGDGRGCASEGGRSMFHVNE